jgi:hypothetical protein
LTFAPSSSPPPSHPPKRLKVSRSTEAQRRFWECPAKFRLYRGGVGSGKTFAGAVEALRQPRGSVGLVCAPTYRMLEDASLETFLALARRGGVLKSYLKGDRVAELAGRRRILFRTADDPEHLRGPNVGWAWGDEAALAHPLTWQILLGRLRLPPYRAWLTTTPRGNRNWTHTTFSTGGPRYATIGASTRDAFWHPAEFVASMLANYSHDFARQEIDGEVLDDAQEGLLQLWWLDALERTVRAAGAAGPRRMGVDLGYGTGRDRFCIVIRDNLSLLYCHASSYVDVAHAALLISQASSEWGVRQEHITYDAGGPGRDLDDYLERYRITEAVPYHGSGSGGKLAVNRRSRCAWRLRQRLDPKRPAPLPRDFDPAKYHPLFVPEAPVGGPQPPFSLPAERPWWPRLKADLAELKFTTIGRKVSLEKKEDLAARIGHSPDEVDALLMTFDDPDD